MYSWLQFQETDNILPLPGLCHARQFSLPNLVVHVVGQVNLSSFLVLIWRFAKDALKGRFAFRELQAATNHFSDEKIVARGRFGHVYEGLGRRLLSGIKRIAKHSHFEMREFHAEVQLGNMPLHWNLVPVISFCLPLKLKEDMLMYSFMLNGSFSSFLRRQPSVKLPLDWPTRKKIAVGAVRGISHLHDHGVIHRYIKPQIILLGENFEVCIVDSGWPSSWTTMKRRVFPGKPASLASAFFTAK
ncbi:hypothetical protein NL676_016992 [Syzygium grande]|nr:hypothetical protein NL676_016992 [Syzygium grande]